MTKSNFPFNRALHSALEFLAKNEIELDYTFPAPNPRDFNDEPPTPELDAFLEKRPRMEDLFLLCDRCNNGYYDQDCGAYLYDFVVFEENVDSLYDAISSDDELMKEFFESLCFDEDGNPREFVRVMDDYLEFRRLPKSVRDLDNASVFFLDRPKSGDLARTICVNDDGIHLFWNESSHEIEPLCVFG